MNLTEHVDSDDELERGGRRPALLPPDLLLLAACAYVGGGEDEENEEHAERRAVVHELHEWRAQDAAQLAVRHEQVDKRHQWHQTYEAEYYAYL